MDLLLPALEGLPPAYLVGGAVRDLLLGGHSVDLDVALEGDAVAAADELAARLDGQAVRHERFGTATVRAGELAVDLATTRRESYSAPGALPDVEPAPLAEDLARRDFTINAMAAGLSGDDLGVVHDLHGGRDDLEAGVVRVLHPRSFVDDPTRILRALRYEARFGFWMDPETEGLARAGSFEAVSGSRVRDELLDLLREPGSPDALARMRELGVDSALHPELVADAQLAASAALGSAETFADPAFAQLAALVSKSPDGVADWVESLQLDRADRDAVLRAARKGPQLVDALRGEPGPAALHALLHCEPPEALALALALGAPGDPVLAYVRDLAGVRLEVTGDDLIRAGVPESPAIGRALEETLRRKLDGEVSGRDEELELALSVARGEA